MVEMNEAQVTGKLCVNEASFQGCGWHRKALASYWGMWVISCSCFESFWESKRLTLSPWPPTSEFCASGSAAMIFVPKLLLHFTQMLQTNCGSAAAFRGSDVGCVLWCPVPRSVEYPSWDWRESRDFDELSHILQESKKLGKALESLSRSEWLHLTFPSHRAEFIARLHKFSWKVCESFIAFRKKASLDLLGDSIKKKDELWSLKMRLFSSLLSGLLKRKIYKNF